MCLNVCTVTRALEKIFPPYLIANDPLTMRKFSQENRLAVPEIQKGGAHVRVYLTVNFRNTLS